MVLKGLAVVFLFVVGLRFSENFYLIQYVKTQVQKVQL